MSMGNFSKHTSSKNTQLQEFETFWYCSCICTKMPNFMQKTYMQLFMCSYSFHRNPLQWPTLVRTTTLLNICAINNGHLFATRSRLRVKCLEQNKNIFHCRLSVNHVTTTVDFWKKRWSLQWRPKPERNLSHCYLQRTALTEPLPLPPSG
jgi:hypothetical protein